MTIRRGDMVVTPKGRIGLCVGATTAGIMAVQFVNNGPLRYWHPMDLRRATLAEIEASPLKGVGCNQADEVSNPQQGAK